MQLIVGSDTQNGVELQLRDLKGFGVRYSGKASAFGAPWSDPELCLDVKELAKKTEICTVRRHFRPGNLAFTRRDY